MKITYKNVSATAKDYKFLVFKKFWGFDDCEAWYFGAWNDRNRANEVALELKNSGFDAECISVNEIFPEGKPAENVQVTIGW